MRYRQTLSILSLFLVLILATSFPLMANNCEDSEWLSFVCPNGILSNPEFESDFSNWDFYSNANIVSDAWAGNKAAEISGYNSGGIGQNYSAHAGQVYSLEVYAKKNTSAGVVVGIKYFDATWNSIGASYLEVNSTNFSAYTLSAKAPEGTSFVQALGWKNEGYGSATFDAFCFESFEVDIPVCSDVKCEISPSWGNYVWALDDGTGWKEYDDGGLYLCNNGDGTLSLLGNIINGQDAHWGSGISSPCGTQDGWEINLTLSDNQSWDEFGGSWVQNNGCGENRVDWDFWAVNGSLVGIGCNTGRTIDITSTASGYRLQIGWGGNSQSCDFGMSTWFSANENGSPVSADIYAHLDAACYFDTRPEDCADGIDNDNDGLVDCYDSDCAPQILNNASFEYTNGISFNDEFEGSPAKALSNGSSLLPNWRMDYGCGSNCYDSYWIDDTADEVNNPKGDHFLWMPGSSYCARQSIEVDLDKCYEITMTVAAWSVPSPQLTTNIALEVYGGGISNEYGGLLTIFEEELPASPNWQNLNWQTLTFTWSPPANATTNFYISQSNATTVARGLVVDEILIKEICCGGGVTPEISCEDGRDVELNFVGINNDIPKTLNLSDVGTMDSVVVEVVYKGGNPGSSIKVKDDSGIEYTAYRQYIGSSAYVYRVRLPATSSVTYSNTSYNSKAQSLSAFVFRNSQPGKTVVSEFTTLGGYNNTYTLDFDIPKDVKDRNIKLVLPISEVTWDNRSLDFTVTAGDVSVSKSRTWGPGNEGFPNGCCIDTIEFYLPDVAPEVDQVSVEIYSPPNGAGQSFVIAATIGIEIFCEELCGDGIDNDGDGLVDNEDQDCLCPEISTPQSQDTTICAGEPIKFQVHSNVPNPPYPYIEFYRFDSPQANPYITSDPKVWLGVFTNEHNGSGSITSWDFPNPNSADKIYYVYGCVKPAPLDPETCFPFVEYIVRSKAAPDAWAGNDATVCSGTNVLLNGFASGGTGPFQFNWDNGLGAGASHMVAPTIKTEYTLTVSGSNGCSDSDQITLSVNPSPSLDAGEDLTICKWDATTLTANGTGLISPYTYQWSHGLGTGNTKVVSPSSTTTYGVTLTSGNGCNDIDEVTVTVTPCVEICYDGVDNDGDGDIDCFDTDCQPVAFAGNDLIICVGSSANLEATVESSSGNYTYTWNQGLGNGATQTVSPLTTTTYTVTVTNQVGCAGTDEVKVTVQNCPENCTDGIDNDGDGLVDCDDPDCIAAAAPHLMDDDFTTCPALPFSDRVSDNDENLQDPSFSIFVQPSYGNATIDANGKFTYTSFNSNCGTDAFVYEVCNQSTGCCAMAVVNLTIGDDNPPVLNSVPADITINCDETVPDPSAVLAYDDCPGIFIDFSEETNEYINGACEGYSITRTWISEDLCGNSSSATQVITVEDLVAPEIFRVYTLANGKKLLAGVSQRTSNLWKYVKFPIEFGEEPIVFSQTISQNELTAVITQQRNISIQGFELRLAEHESSNGSHASEQVAWMAMEPGTIPDFLESSLLAGANDNLQTLNLTQNYSPQPLFFANALSTNELDPVSVRIHTMSENSVEFFLQEETSRDAETGHMDEDLGYLALVPGKEFKDEDGFVIGESGSLNLTNAWATVALNGEYVKPVVIMGGVSNNDSEATTVRVRNVSPSGFEVRLQEWDGQDGTHLAESVPYLVMEGALPASPQEYCNPAGLAFNLGENVHIVDNCDDQVSVNHSTWSSLQADGMEISRSWIGMDDCGNPMVYSRTDQCRVAAVRLKTLLYGAYHNNAGSSLMRDDLRVRNLIPLDEPFTGLFGFQHVGRGGGESVSSNRLNVTGDDAIVDWLFLEIRDKSKPDSIVTTASVLLQRDGDIESVDGEEVLYFEELAEGNYFVAIRHRNHIGFITERSWHLSSTNIPTLDMSDLATDMKGNISAGSIVNNKRAQWGGDFNGDRKVIYQGPYNDIFFLFSRVLSDTNNTSYLANYISVGYDRNDFNLDGNIIYQGPGNDRAMLLYHTVMSHPGNYTFLANYIASGNLP